MADAYIIGSYSTQFKKWPEKSFRDMSRDAVVGVLEDAGMDRGDEVEFVWFGHTGTGGWGPVGYFGQICLVPLVREGILPKGVPIFNVENACATGSMALLLGSNSRVQFAARSGVLSVASGESALPNVNTCSGSPPTNC